MHMADALISPVVGGAMTIFSTGAAAYSIKKVQNNLDDSKIPLMGVMGAFIFAAQMINFTIPGTGSSGHLGGALLLAVLLGPFAGFLTMASVLLIQALFFADGGLLAFGCNLFNMGFISCFIIYPLIYKGFFHQKFTAGRIAGASMLSAVTGLQMGAFGVVVETVVSGRTELPFGAFALLMQPVHLAIGVVEGLVTAVVLIFLWKARPELVEQTSVSERSSGASLRKVLIVLLVIAVLTAGVLSLFASANPDGLEWSIEKVTGSTELPDRGGIYGIIATIQEKTAFLPDYALKVASEEGNNPSMEDTGTFGSIIKSSTPGIIGGFLTLILIGLIGFSVRMFKRRKKSVKP